MDDDEDGEEADVWCKEWEEQRWRHTDGWFEGGGEWI